MVGQSVGSNFVLLSRSMSKRFCPLVRKLFDTNESLIVNLLYACCNSSQDLLPNQITEVRVNLSPPNLDELLSVKTAAQQPKRLKRRLITYKRTMQISSRTD